MNNPYFFYQREKQIQKTVGVSASLYTMNLAALTAYQNPSNESQIIVQPSGVTTSIPANLYWNQMSDRAKPSNSSNASNASNASLTRKDATGVDVKHNYYERYLNRVKGKLLRRGIIPILQETQYRGGKVIKMGVIDCPCAKDDTVFENTYYNPIEHVQYTYYVGDTVYVPSKKRQGTIVQILGAVVAYSLIVGTMGNTFKVQLGTTGEIVYLKYSEITSTLVPECEPVDKSLTNLYACTIQSKQFADR